MTATRISLSTPGFVRAESLEPAEGDAWSAPAGVNDWVLYGPYISAKAGLWRIRALARPLESGGEAAWDVYADARVYAARRLPGQVEAVVRLPDTAVLEFRFTALGSGLWVEGVEMESILMDREAISPERLHDLIETLGADPNTEAEAVHHLLQRLARTGAVRDAEQLRRAYRERAHPLVPPGRRRVAALFNALNTPGAARDERLSRHVDAEEIAGFVAAQSFHFIDLNPLSTAGGDALAAHGYRPAFLQATWLERNLWAPRRPWQTAFGYPGAPTESQRPAMFEALANTDLSFQAGLVEGDGLTAYDPVTGEELRSRHGFVWQFYGLAQTFYRFEGHEVFYVAVGNFPGGRMFVYLPRTGVVAVCEEPVLRWYPYEKLIQELNSALMHNLALVGRYLGRPASPAAVCGLNNLGHYFWNEMGGLHWAAAEGLFDKVRAVVKLPKQYVDAQELAWELADTPSARMDEPIDAFRYCLESHLLPIRFSDAQITPAYVDRLQSAAARFAGPAGRPPHDAPRPLIWINVRSHNKIWVDQAEGFANILNALYEEHGATAAYIDGTPDCTGVMDEIRRLTRPEIPLYDGLNVPVFDSLNWAFAIDAYICTVGSGLALVSWLANKPGVAHAEQGHMQQMIWWRYARPDLVPPLLPELDQIQDKGEGWYCDYELDWRVPLDLLRRALDSRPRDLGAETT